MWMRNEAEMWSEITLLHLIIMLSKATFHFDQTNLDRGIAESAPPDLTLLAGGRSYQINSYLAAAKSNYIYRILLSDPLTMSIEIDLPKKKLTPH